MKISVIMPCHNAGPWVQEALQSVATQTYPAHEIIVINDNSTDDSVAQIEASGVPVKLLHTQFGNAAAARNAGVREATGDWIAFLDADDLWYPHHLENSEKLLRHGNDVAYLAHNDQLRCDLDPRGLLVERDTHPPVSIPTAGLRGDVYFAWWAERSWFCTCTLLVRRDRFLAVGGFDVTQRRRHDFELFLRVVHERTWAYHPAAAAVYRYRINPDCVSGDYMETSYYALRALVINRKEYNGPVMRQAIRKWALKTARYVVLSEESEKREIAWALCVNELTPGTRAVYQVLRGCPSIVFFARRIKHSLLSAW